MMLEAPAEKHLCMDRLPQGAFHQTILLLSSFTQVYLSHHLAHGVRFSKCAKGISMDSHRLFLSVFDNTSMRPKGSYPAAVSEVAAVVRLPCKLGESIAGQEWQRLHAVSCIDIMYMRL